MKKNHLHSLFILLLCMIGVNVSAHDIEVPNNDGVTIYYNYINNNTELAVTFAGSWYGYVKNEYSGVVVIPEEVTLEGSKLKVTRIDNSAFSGCFDLTSITIPNSVTSIGDYAFCECRSLSSVIIPDGVTSIGEYTFSGCYDLTSVTIPNSVTSIGNYAFDNCTSLASITIPNKVTTIGVGVFEYCNGLTSIDIPNSVTSIEDYTFAGCKNLTSIIIGNSVASIGNYAFAGCRSLTSATIPENVATIGDYAFYKCYGLTSIDIGDGVTSIGNSAFWECTSLPSVTIGNSVTTIGEWAFYNCSNLKSITIPRSVKHIGNSVFFNCYDLNKVFISDLEAWCNIQFDGDFFSRYHLYLNNKEITNLIIPEGVTSIGNYAFAKCYRLLSITIPDGVTSIGYHAFALCSNLQNIYCYLEQVSETEDNVFEDSNYDATLHVPATSVSAYQATEPWKNFKKIVALPAQYDYRPFVEDSKVWVVRVSGLSSDGSPMEPWIDYCYLDGDTIIGGQTCKRMMCVTNDNPSPRYIGAWYEQDKKVYFAGEYGHQLELLYDFTLSSGDNIQGPDGNLWTVNKITGDITGFKGTYYDFGNNDNVIERWFEGIGSESWPHINHPEYLDGSKGVLLACIAGDEVVYYNSEEDDPYTLGARKRRFDFTHTIKTKPKARIKQEESNACINSSERDVARPKVKSRMRNGAEETMYGEYNDQQLCINIGPLDDTYLLCITDESDKAVYEKTIYVGNIVALNIDISTYTKGRYTVTVENSRESFTGIFGAGNADVDGDGILTAKDIIAIINVISSKTTDEALKSAADIIRIANEIIGK